ncbi:unnamed protein product [Ceutorhynchus assimilis]|uniref:Torsin-1A C-terminal domain-containing protein n=1 Tax=Ceutorhynchus assimilis TaxID=467358 RepID=A0A9N9MZF7_9CUCU|nr:unnamed protein product [Ceutorhynchus assimilis]
MYNQFTIAIIFYFSKIVSAHNLLGIIPVSPLITNSQYNPYCLMNECCNDEYVKFDRHRLMKNLTENVYGQPLLETALEALTAHFNPYYTSPKPLTLSFHGMTGTGKNFVSNLIADSLFRKGSKSQFVHHFIGRMHFSEVKNVSENIQNLYHWLTNNITQCPTQLFIFDEVDKMVPEIINSIKPLIDYNHQGVAFSQSVFIFLSNIAADIINEHYHDLFISEGKGRDDLKLFDFENLISKGAFNKEGGFFHSDTISNNLIDHYIPFLPLEQKHIVQCIEQEFKLRGVNSPEKKHIDEVMKFIEWGPDESKLFSKTGCKRLGPKVASIVSKWYRHAGHSKDEF